MLMPVTWTGLPVGAMPPGSDPLCVSLLRAGERIVQDGIGGEDGVDYRFVLLVDHLFVEPEEQRLIRFRRSRSGADLVQEVSHIQRNPVLRNLAICKAEGVARWRLDSAPAGRHALERSALDPARSDQHFNRAVRFASLANIVGQIARKVLTLCSFRR